MSAEYNATLKSCAPLASPRLASPRGLASSPRLTCRGGCVGERPEQPTASPGSRAGGPRDGSHGPGQGGLAARAAYASLRHLRRLPRANGSARCATRPHSPCP
eukprot:scaffold174786_cov22-Tisochrysis_lutea.AAC.1